jgi:hypothetical protein
MILLSLSKEAHVMLIKANFDSFVDDSNELDDDEDSVLDEVVAHMSVQNEPMSEETVNALQVFSTF